MTTELGGRTESGTPKAAEREGSSRLLYFFPFGQTKGQIHGGQFRQGGVGRCRIGSGWQNSVSYRSEKVELNLRN